MPAGADDDWQLVSAASSSSMTPNLHHRDHTSQRQQDSQSASPSGQQQPSPGNSKAGQAQDFPELNNFSNEELVALLSDPSKYRKLVDSVMAKSHVAQVQLSWQLLNVQLLLRSVEDMSQCTATVNIFW